MKNYMKNYINRLITITETRDIKSLEKNISYLEDEIENTEEGIRRGRVALTAIRSAPDIQDNINFSLFLDELETRLEAVELNPLGRNPRDPLEQHGENYIFFYKCTSTSRIQFTFIKSRRKKDI